MDRERSRVQGPVTVHDLATIVDEDEVLDADVLEVHPERIDPEVVEQLRVSCRDVTGYALVESEVSEQAECGGKALLAVPALVVDALERREPRRNSV